jgi:hypothetical protein
LPGCRSVTKKSANGCDIAPFVDGDASERGDGLNAMDCREPRAQAGCFGERELEDVIGGGRIIDADDAGHWFDASASALRVRSPDHHDRACCMGSQVTAHGSDQQSGEAAQTPGGDDHNLSIAGLCEQHWFGGTRDELAFNAEAWDIVGGPFDGFIDDSFGHSAQAAVGRTIRGRPQRHVGEERPDEGMDDP